MSRTLRAVVGFVLILVEAVIVRGWRFPSTPLPSPTTTVSERSADRPVASASVRTKQAVSSGGRAVPRKVRGSEKIDWKQLDFPRLTREVEALRSLRFMRPVPCGYKTPAQVRAYLRRELDRETDWAATDAMLLQFGFIPRKFPLKRFMIEFYTEQVAGYYDPDTGRFNMTDAVSDDPSMAAVTGMGFQSAVTDSMVIHEMDHALQDQYFNLHALEHGCEGHSDRSLATTALIEGDATLVMMDALYKSLGLPASSRPPLSTLMHDNTVLQGGGPVFQRAPLYIRSCALFPYIAGACFVDYWRRRGGWKAVNRIWHHPPRSTRVILHPETWHYPSSPLLTVRLPPQGTLCAAEGMRQEVERTVSQDSLGEEQIRLLLEQWLPQMPPQERNAICSGWRADSFRIFSHGPRRHMVWESAWSSAVAARRFASAVATVLEVSHHVHLQASTGPRSTLEEWHSPRLQMKRQGNRVLILEGLPDRHAVRAFKVVLGVRT